MKRLSLVNTGDISPEINLGEYRLRRKGRVKEMSFNFLRKREVERSDTDEFEIEGVTYVMNNLT